MHLVHHRQNRENQGVGATTLTGYDAAVALGAEIIVKLVVAGVRPDDLDRLRAVVQDVYLAARTGLR